MDSDFLNNDSFFNFVNKKNMVKRIILLNISSHFFNKN